jgi:hypothetical protein
MGRESNSGEPRGGLFRSQDGLSCAVRIGKGDQLSSVTLRRERGFFSGLLYLQDQPARQKHSLGIIPDNRVDE